MTEAKHITPIELLHLRRASFSTRADRHDDAHLALVLEGGGMRGVVSVAMAAALEQEGYYASFDSVHGSSAGACGGAYFAAKQAAVGTTVYYEDINNTNFIDLLRWTRRRPIMDTDFLLDEIMRKRKPLNVRTILESPGLMHIVLTDISAHGSHSISSFADVDDFFSVLKGSICLPLIAGYDVVVRGTRYFDGGVTQHLAIDSAMAAGATHIILLLTRPEDQLVRPISGRVSVDGLALWLAYGSKMKRLLDQRRKSINEGVTAARSGWLGSDVRICGIARKSGATPLGRLTTSGRLLRAAAAEGREAVLRDLSCGGVKD